MVPRLGHSDQPRSAAARHPRACYASDMDEDLLRLGRRPAPAPATGPVHPGVLEIPDAPGFALVLAAWDRGESASVLHAALRDVVEAALVGELARAPDDLADFPGRRLASLRLMSMEPLPPEALEAFAFREEAPKDDTWRDATMHLRGEAQALGKGDVEPVEHWRVKAAMPDHADVLLALERAVAAGLKGEVFGSKPGAFFACLNEALDAQGQPALPPRIDSLDVLENLLVTREANVVRWIPPLLFQCLCDAVAVVASMELGRTLQWALSTPDDEGFAPPPLIRARDADGWAHVPVGEHLMRWCVVPLREGEDVPKISDWVLHQFRSE